MPFIGECAEYTGWIAVLGTMSAGVYQIYWTILNEEPASFSPLFLAGYVGGDLLNTIGTFWNHQMPFQKAVAVIGLLIDGLMALQYVWYHYVLPRISKHADDGTRWRESRPYGRHAVTAMLFGLAHSAVLFAPEPGTVPSSMLLGAPESIVGSSEFSDWQPMIGAACSYTAEFMFFCALVPQVLQNFRDRCTGGICMLLFLSDFVGSGSYLMTILAAASALPAAERGEFLLKETPYLMGSGSSVIIDTILLLQYWLYPAFNEEMQEAQRTAKLTECTERRPMLDWQDNLGYGSSAIYVQRPPVGAYASDEIVASSSESFRSSPAQLDFR